MLFKYGVQWGWMGTSPIDGVNRITKIRNERTRFLTCRRVTSRASSRN